jgi:hypothetical protein
MVIPVGLLLLAVPAMAQESLSYKLNEYVFNAGGNPKDGSVLSSASYQVTLDSVGEGLVDIGMLGGARGSGSYGMDGGFGSCYPPPGEVIGLGFTDNQTLEWDPERSVGVYHLYRDLMSNLMGLGYGTCEQQDLTAATATDSDPVPVQDGFFYLVTAQNRLDEEGTKGYRSDGAERQGNACP